MNIADELRALADRVEGETHLYARISSDRVIKLTEHPWGNVLVKDSYPYDIIKGLFSKHFPVGENWTRIKIVRDE